MDYATDRDCYVMLAVLWGVMAFLGSVAAWVIGDFFMLGVAGIIASLWSVPLVAQIDCNAMDRDLRKGS